MKKYIVETGFNKETKKTLAKGFDTLEEAVEFADKIKDTTSDYPIIRKMVYQTITAEEIKMARR